MPIMDIAECVLVVMAIIAALLVVLFAGFYFTAPETTEIHTIKAIYPSEHVVKVVFADDQNNVYDAKYSVSSQLKQDLTYKMVIRRMTTAFPEIKQVICEEVGWKYTGDDTPACRNNAGGFGC